MNPPRLANHGYATIYLSFRPGVFAEEHRHAKSVLKINKDDPFEGVLSPEPEILYLLGQARFAARVKAIDYRSIVRRAYPDRASHALVSNAVFSIPYERETERAFSHAPGEEGTLRYLTHLRVRRTIYTRDPVLAESLIIERLRELADQMDGETTIEAGLGWADFIVSGVFHPSKFNDFLKNLVEFNRVSIGHRAIGDPHCVFKRSLTLLGYSWNRPDAAPAVVPNLKALMFIRARPGHLSTVESCVRRRFPLAKIEFVDGKIDVIATIDPETSTANGVAPAADFFKQHEILSEKTGHESIEKFETHLVFGSTLFEDWRTKDPDAEVETPACGCADVQHPPCETEHLPERLHSAVKNMEFLFSATMRDPANCCDARSAVLACEDALDRLVKQGYLRNVNARYAGPREADALHDHNVANLRRIDQWVRTSERILRQRTVGSFEEFLGQSDRAVSYRGGAQKVLTVADNLMNDFYAKVVGLRNPEPFFTSLYDSAGSVEIINETGFVRLPVWALFFLPGVVPDLWHEVGTFHYFKTILAKDLKLDDAFPEHRTLYYDLGDHYGDLISFVYGFRLDLEQFAIALVEGWLASDIQKIIPKPVRERSFIHILVRIVAIYEFFLRHVAHDRDSETQANVLSACWIEVVEVIAHYCGPERVPAMNDKTLDYIQVILGKKVLADRLTYLRKRIEHRDLRRLFKLAQPAPDEAFQFGEPAALRSFNTKTDLNDEFRKLLWAVLKNKKLPRNKRPKAFAYTAALIRSAALEYHRRAAVKDAQNAPTRPITKGA